MGNTLIFWDSRLTILTVISLFNSLCAFYILFRNRQNIVNRAFFAFVISLVFWSVTILAFFVTPDLLTAKIAMQFAYFAAILIGLSFLHFANLYGFRLFHYQPISKIAMIMATAVVAFIIFSPSYLVEAVFQNDSIRDVSLNRLGHTVFASYFLTISACILYTFISKYSRSDGVIKMQLRYIAFGCMTTLFLGVFFNLILPGVGNHHYIWLGPYFTLATSALAIYTIKVCQRIK